MKGGTTFYFITDGIHSALEQAKRQPAISTFASAAAVSTIRQYLNERLVDEMHLVVRPIFMGRGEKLFDGLDLRELGYKVDKFVPGERAMHLLVSRQD
jgi:dihydrofolate reductase